MKLFVGILTLCLALAISGVAGYFSVVGLAALFAAAFIPVVIMGTVLETGKLVTVGWLHANWRNNNVSFLHKSYLTIAIGVLMMITALGIYGFLAKGHLEQEAPLGSVDLKISQIQQKIDQTSTDRKRLDQQLTQLNQSVTTILGVSKNARDAQSASRIQVSQKKERDQLVKDMAAKDAEINALTDSLLPLKTQINEVSAKLGPIKYVAQLFGWKDSNTAVQMVILMIMIAFDPLAVVMVISSTISFGEYFEERKNRKTPDSPNIIEKIVEVPIETIVEKIIEVEKRIEVPFETIVEKTVEVPVDRIVEKYIDKIVEVPVDRIVEKIVEKEVYLPAIVETKTDKQILLDILEKNPELLNDVIDTISESQKQNDNNLETLTPTITSWSPTFRNK